MTTTTDHLADVPHPAGAVDVGPWYDVQHALEKAGRYFRGSSWVVARDVEDVEILIDGTQHADGTIERFVMFAEGGIERLTELTSDQARQLGRALIAAADEVEQMEQYDRITVS